MILLTAENISKSYSEKKLLSNINLGINEGDKIGLIGINGAGKSTLLKIIAGVEPPDQGAVVKGNLIRLEYLPQNPDFDPKATVMEQVFKGDTPVMKLIRDYEKAINSQALADERMLQLTQAMDAMDAWNLASEARAVLTRLGCLDFNAKMGDLSGGQKKRVALAAALVNPADLLILDEPTNHLDNDVIDWLEQYLNKRTGAVLMITHDRYFLDRVVNQILELDRGNLYAYTGNYSYYLEKKLEREELELAAERKRKSLLRQELAWIKRGAKARSTKQKARLDRFNLLQEPINQGPGEKLHISVASSRLGKKTVELEQVSKSFNGVKVIDDFTFLLPRNGRYGVIGPNGCGKSTLLNIISGGLIPDSGNVAIGATVRFGYYTQEIQHMDGSLRAIEYIKEGSEYLSTAEGEQISASQMLERFLFSPSLQWSLIEKLSGGEKRRLHLLRVLMEAPNILLLDEPTNDLDIDTLVVLEDYLEDFAGAVIAVSHDRYFLDRVTDHLLSFEGAGKIVEYTGNYSDFKENNREAELVSGAAGNKRKEILNKTAVRAGKNDEPKKREPALKFTFQEQKEYAEIDNIIAELEDQLAAISAQIQQAAADYVLLQQLLGEKDALEASLDEKMNRWVYLNEKAEHIANNK